MQAKRVVGELVRVGSQNQNGSVRWFVSQYRVELYREINFITAYSTNYDLSR
jgi:hypothetical protein